MSTVNNLIAAELSLAAYTPIGDYQGHGGSLPADEYLEYPDSPNPLNTAVPLPSGWSVEVSSSGFTGSATAPTDQFLIFVNATEKQVVIAFRGTNSTSTLLFSDLNPLSVA
jgi:hypothetical protein